MPSRRSAAEEEREPAADTVPSWIVGLSGVAAVASALFSLLLFFNR